MKIFLRVLRSFIGYLLVLIDLRFYSALCDIFFRETFCMVRVSLHFHECRLAKRVLLTLGFCFWVFRHFFGKTFQNRLFQKN